MKTFILLVLFGAVLANYENPGIPRRSTPFHLFEPAYTFEPLNMKAPARRDQGIFFIPAMNVPLTGDDNQLDGQAMNPERAKRETVGALSILTNHAQPILTEVKADVTSMDNTEKVTPPENTFFELKSFRKSWPLPNKLELARSISRLLTLAVLVISGIVEFFPLIKVLSNAIYSYMYF